MVSPGNGRKIQIALVHTDLFNLFRKCPKVVHQHPAFFMIHLMVRRFHHQIRALTKGIRNGFPRADAISFGRQGFGEHHTPARLLVAADDSGYLTQILLCSIF